MCTICVHNTKLSIRKQTFWGSKISLYFNGDEFQGSNKKIAEAGEAVILGSKVNISWDSVAIFYGYSWYIYGINS